MPGSIRKGAISHHVCYFLEFQVYHSHQTMRRARVVANVRLFYSLYLEQIDI